MQYAIILFVKERIEKETVKKERMIKNVCKQIWLLPNEWIFNEISNLLSFYPLICFAYEISFLLQYLNF